MGIQNPHPFVFFTGDINMSESEPKAIATDLALMTSAWKMRLWAYFSDKHSLEQISQPGYFSKCVPNIIPGNFVFINDKDGNFAIRVFAMTEMRDEETGDVIADPKKFKPQYYLRKSD